MDRSRANHGNKSPAATSRATKRPAHYRKQSCLCIQSYPQELIRINQTSCAYLGPGRQSRQIPQNYLASNGLPNEKGVLIRPPGAYQVGQVLDVLFRVGRLRRLCVTYHLDLDRLLVVAAVSGAVACSRQILRQRLHPKPWVGILPQPSIKENNTPPFLCRRLRRSRRRHRLLVRKRVMRSRGGVCAGGSCRAGHAWLCSRFERKLSRRRSLRKPLCTTYVLSMRDACV